MTAVCLCWKETCDGYRYGPATTAASTNTSATATATASTATLPNTGGDSSAFGLFLGLALVALLGGVLLQRRAHYSK